MMPRLEYFLVAESISVDRETNQLSVFNVLDDLELSLPTQIPQLVALSSWNIEPHERDQDLQVMLRILLRKADGTVETKEFPVNFTAEASRQRIYHRLGHLPVEVAGDLKFEVLLNGEHKAGHLLTIRASKGTD